MNLLMMAVPGPVASALWLAAEGTSGPGFDAGTLGQYGVLGVVNFILFRFAQQAYNREKDRADASDAEVKRLNSKITDEYIDTLHQQVAAANKNIEVLERTGEVLHRVETRLDIKPPRSR